MFSMMPAYDFQWTCMLVWPMKMQQEYIIMRNIYAKISPLCAKQYLL